MKRVAIWCMALAAGLMTFAAMTLQILTPPRMFDGVTRLSATRMIAVLEGRFARPGTVDWSTVTGLIVLGGAPERFTEAFRLAREHPHLRVVISGASAYEMGLVAKADRAIRQRLIFENKSQEQHRNTFGNAIYSKELVAPSPDERWLLVTSASHMPRAIGTFHKIAFFVEAWPVATSSSSVERLAYIARHEWLGLASYWLQGRTTALLPG